MQTAPNTPLEIFNMPQYLEIPLFQRPYVWNLDEQWEPLWQDIRRMAELRLNAPGTQVRHFLGAVVFQALPQPVGGIATSQVIDGQQRLTTLQIVFDAASLAFEQAGDLTHSQQLRNLTHNGASYVPTGDQLLKLKHTNRDAEAFHEVMEAQPPLDYETLKHGGSKIAAAHAYFADRVERWLGDPISTDFAQRAESLTRVLDSGLQVVTITLNADENSQEIFETLNARGTPLTAADLIKNFVFQRLAQEGADTAHAYEKIWPFDTKFWEREVSVGRSKVSRSSLYLNQWLTSRLGEEVSPHATFTRFKTFMGHDTDASMKDVLTEIRDQAALYQHWWGEAESSDHTLDATAMCFYRSLALDSQLLRPLLIWLHAPGRGLGASEVSRAIQIAESWMMRRSLLRLPSSDLGRVLADVIRGLSGVEPDGVAAHVENHLAMLNVASTYWPGDDEVRRSLLSEPVYRKYPRQRLRAVLEALENSMRAEKGSPQVTRWKFPIEHVLPQSWQEHWPVAELEEQLDRDAHVHRLGNLTLLTESLNAGVSNREWNHKRGELAKHNTLLLNARMTADVGNGGWSEDAIDTRSEALTQRLLKIWPVPEGHVGDVVDARSRASFTVTVRDLVVSGHLAPGATLTFRRGEWTGHTAHVRDDGLIDLDGSLHESPSGAGRALCGRATNGWTNWSLDDGRRLADVRAAYMGKSRASERMGFDWMRVHALLAALPAGSWTTYGALADAVGTTAQPIANHVSSCLRCENAQRVLRFDGRVADGFAWSDPNDTRDPRVLLESEGLRFDGDVADPEQRLDADDLSVLASERAGAHEGRSVYRVSLGRGAAYLDDALVHGYIGTGWLLDVDLGPHAGNGHEDFHAKFNDLVKAKDGIESQIGAGLAVGQIWVVVSQMADGDLVLVPTGDSSYRVATIVGPYEFAGGSPVPHRRPVDWHGVELSRGDMSEELRRSLQFNGTVQNLRDHREELDVLMRGRVGDA
ncbi:GmrSD restriction endonuclease domain-containing protein [Demequina aestuarii]|uniref:GmrSD restriction endonuclease domain-containing protein n=1 Tax=Demequina aestuarii TaxID=327095 RepID=UPI0009FBB5C9|nr:DUF262 domain-containing protein [Demequina aestuarii]